MLHKQYLLLPLQAHITRPTDKATQITVLRLWKNGKRCRQASTGASKQRGVSTSLNLCHCEKVPAKVMMQCKAQEGAGGSDEMMRDEAVSCPRRDRRLPTTLLPHSLGHLRAQGSEVKQGEE